MREHFVFIRPAAPQVGPARRVSAWAMGENDAVAAVSRRNLGGVIFAVRDARSTLPL